MSNAPIEPKNVRVLLVESKGSTRQEISSLLRDCSYQVTAVKSGRDALQLLAHHSSTNPDPPFDLIIKEHEPPRSNACRLMHKVVQSKHYRSIPVVVVSTQDDRETVARCLNLGAVDFLVKPLRHNELRNIWTRVWWWRRQTASNSFASGPYGEPGATPHFQCSSGSSMETKCSDEEEEPISKEGSAPGGNGNGSNGNGSNGNGSNGNGSNGSKENNGTSRVEAKPHKGDGNGNGSSNNKNGNGNSATKNGHNGSNGHGASTTLIPERPGSCALVGTAEGKQKPLEGGCAVHHHHQHQHQEHHQGEPLPAGRCGLNPSQNGTSSRKRTASQMGQRADGDFQPPPSERTRTKSNLHQMDRNMGWSVGGTTASGSVEAQPSEDTIHRLTAAAAAAAAQRGSNTLTTSGFPGPSGPSTAGASGVYPAFKSRSLLQGPPGPYQHSTGAFGQLGRSHWGASTQPGELAAAAATAALPPGSHPPLLPHMPPAAAFFNPYAQMLSQPAQMLAPSVNPLALWNAAAVGLAASTRTNSSSHTPSAGLGGDPSGPHPGPYLGLGSLLPDQAMVVEAAAARAAQVFLQHGGGGDGQGTLNQQGVAQQLQQQQQQQQNAVNAMAAIGSLLYHAQAAQAAQQAAALPIVQAWRPAAAPAYAPLPPGGPAAAAPCPLVPTSMPDGSLLSGRTGTQAASLPCNRQSQVGNTAEGVVAGGHGRRATALEKYRKKRQNLKFSRTIRYECRQQLAQARPRLRGQFVKHNKADISTSSVGGALPGEGCGSVPGDPSTLGQGLGGYSMGFWGPGLEQQNQNFGPGMEELEEEEEEYDRGEEEEDMDEDEEEIEEEAAQADRVEPQEEEADVVNSLRTDPGQPPAPPEGVAPDLPPAYVPGGPHYHNAPSSKTAQARLGSQSGHGGSRGSLGPGLHSTSAGCHSFGGLGAGHRFGGDGPALGVAAAAAEEGAGMEPAGPEGNTSNGNGNGKNGSDSGSNSPDENGSGAHKLTEKHLHSPGTSYKHIR